MTYKLQQNPDGSYDIAIEFSRDEAEFSSDLISGGFLHPQTESAIEFIKRQSKNLHIRAVKVIISGILVATIPLSAFAAIPASASATDNKYSLAYLYVGNTQQQIDYVKATRGSINVVAPSWLDITEDGSLDIKYSSPQLIKSMHDSGIRVTPFLSNHWNRAAGIAFLAQPDHYSTLLANYVISNDLDGLNIDIENVTHNERAQYTEFVRLLRQKLPAGKELSVAVAANPNGWTQGWHGSYDYAELGKYADTLFIMAYDESYQGGPSGPVASIGFVEKSIQYALKYVPANKIVVGLPLFGRLWSDTGFNGQGVYLNYGDMIINQYNASVSFDAASQSPRATFTIRDSDPQITVLGRTLTPGNYTMWMENKQSIEKKLSLVTKYNLKGAGSWALGQETADIWQDYTAVLNNISIQTPSPAPSMPSPQTSTPQTTTKPTATRPQASSSQTPAASSALQQSETETTQESTEITQESTKTIALDMEMDLPDNFVEQVYAAAENAEIFDAPGGRPIAAIATGTALFMVGVTLTGYFIVRWKNGRGYVKKTDIFRQNNPPQ